MIITAKRRRIVKDPKNKDGMDEEEQHKDGQQQADQPRETWASLGDAQQAAQRQGTWAGFRGLDGFDGLLEPHHVPGHQGQVRRCELKGCPGIGTDQGWWHFQKYHPRFPAFTPCPMCELPLPVPHAADDRLTQLFKAKDISRHVGQHDGVRKKFKASDFMTWMQTYWTEIEGDVLNWDYIEFTTPRANAAAGGGTTTRGHPHQAEPDGRHTSTQLRRRSRFHVDELLKRHDFDGVDALLRGADDVRVTKNFVASSVADKQSMLRCLHAKKRPVGHHVDVDHDDAREDDTVDADDEDEDEDFEFGSCPSHDNQVWYPSFQ